MIAMGPDWKIGFLGAGKMALALAKGIIHANLVRAANVIDVRYGHAEIVPAIERAVSPEFRASLNGMSNPYGDGRAADRILAKLKWVEIGDRLLRKIFHDEGAAR